MSKKKTEMAPDYQPPPWVFICNRCNTHHFSDAIPSACQKCRGVEFRVEHADQTPKPLPGQMELFP